MQIHAFYFIIYLFGAISLFPFLIISILLMGYWFGDGVLLYEVLFGNKRELIADLLRGWTSALPLLLPFSILVMIVGPYIGNRWGSLAMTAMVIVSGVVYCVILENLDSLFATSMAVGFLMWFFSFHGLSKLYLYYLRKSQP